MGGSDVTDGELVALLLRLKTEHGSMAAVRRLLKKKLSETALSLIVSGKYGARLDGVKAKVVAVLQVDCPAEQWTIGIEDCMKLQKAAAAECLPSSPALRRKYQECAECAQNQRGLYGDKGRQG
jgi:hypothetical protein